MSTEGTQRDGEYFVLRVVLPAQEGQPAVRAHHGSEAGEGSPGSSKNMTPKLLITTSTEARRSGHAWASPARTGRWPPPPARPGAGRRPASEPTDPGPPPLPALPGLPRRSACCLRRRDRRFAAPAPDIQHLFSRHDGRATEQVRGEVLVLGEMPLAVLDPVLAAGTVPALRLRRVSRRIYLAHRGPLPVPSLVIMVFHPIQGLTVQNGNLSHIAPSGHKKA